jgi:hypothetical protein
MRKTVSFSIGHNMFQPQELLRQGWCIFYLLKADII